MEQHCPGQKWEPETKWKRQEDEGWEAKVTGPCCDDVTGFMHSEAKRFRGATNRNELRTSPMR